MTIHQTACQLDCPDACTLDVEVVDGRVVSLSANDTNPVTKGFICPKVRRFGEHVHGSARIRSPAVRDGPKGSGKFRDVSWDEALTRIVEALQRVRDEFGGEAVLPLSYGGSNGILTQGTLDERLFRRLGAARLVRALCSAPASGALSAMYGGMPGVMFEDYVHAKLIVVWGANPTASNTHLLPFIRRARRNGTKLVVVDPRRTALARTADLHIDVQPGTDFPFALGIARWLFENGRADRDFLREHTAEADELERRCYEWTSERVAAVTGVDETKLAELAELYAESSPAVIRCGWGLERNRNGGSAVASVLALPAVAGKFGVRGGGFSLSNTGVWKIDIDAAAAEPPAETRFVNLNRVGAELAPGSAIRFAFVYNLNPIATVPDQNRVRTAFEREDLFTVVFDQVHTDTAPYADVLLPATTFLEHDDVDKSYGCGHLRSTTPVIPPVGLARSNNQVFGELVHRLGLARPDDPETTAELTSRLLGADASRAVPALTGRGFADPACGPKPVSFVDVLPGTTDQRIHLVPEALEPLYVWRSDPATDRYPLALISPATNKTITSTLGQLYDEIASVAIHPRDAASRGIGDGDEVRIHNELGEVHCHARVTDEVRQGVVDLPKGLWAKHTLNGSTATALAPDTYADVGEGACFNDARVDVSPLSPRSTSSSFE